MSLDGMLAPPGDLLAKRFFVVGYLPTAAAALFLLTLGWAGAPGRAVDFGRAWRTAAGLRAGELVAIAAAVLLVTVITGPLQLPLVRLMEGGWPRWLGAGAAGRRQLRRRRRLSARAVLAGGADLAGEAAEPSPAEVQRAGVAAVALRRRFPARDHLVRPTALGNVLAAMEDTAGTAYGLDAAVAWPRLYPLLPESTRAIVDARRDGLDGAVRLAATGAVTAVAALGLLARSGWWLLLVAIPLAVAVAAYAGALAAAVAYAEAVHAAFDLHRFALVAALRLPRPADRAAEVAANQALCDEWRQNVRYSPAYAHPPEA